MEEETNTNEKKPGGDNKKQRREPKTNITMEALREQKTEYERKRKASEKEREDKRNGRQVDDFLNVTRFEKKEGGGEYFNIMVQDRAGLLSNKKEWGFEVKPHLYYRKSRDNIGYHVVVWKGDSGIEITASVDEEGRFKGYGKIPVENAIKMMESDNLATVIDKGFGRVNDRLESAKNLLNESKRFLLSEIEAKEKRRNDSFRQDSERQTVAMSSEELKKVREACGGKMEEKKKEKDEQTWADKVRGKEPSQKEEKEKKTESKVPATKRKIPETSRRGNMEGRGSGLGHGRGMGRPMERPKERTKYYRKVQESDEEMDEGQSEDEIDEENQDQKEGDMMFKQLVRVWLKSEKGRRYMKSENGKMIKMMIDQLFGNEVIEQCLGNEFFTEGVEDDV